MALASSTLRGFCCLPVIFPTASSVEQLPSVSSVRYPRPKCLPSVDYRFTGYNSVINQVRLQWSSLGAVGGDTTTVLNDCTEERMSPLDASDSTSEIGGQTLHNTKRDDNDDIEATRVCDKLIDIFMVDKPNPTEWRKLLAFSRNWIEFRPHFFKRCQDRAESEDDPGMKHKLFRLGRKLKEVDEDIERHTELIELVKGAPSDIGAIVARRRKDFTKEFFVHFYTVAESYFENPATKKDLARLGDTCLAAVQHFDNASESKEALNAAELNIKDILSSSYVDVAHQKIDNLAQKNQIDSPLVLMNAKAWSAAKETSIVEEEVKDMLYHQYLNARESLQRNKPKEVRILKYLLMMDDRDDQLCALKDAFTPGVEFEGTDADCLYTTPKKLHALIASVIDAYHSRRAGVLMREARVFLKPTNIKRLEELKKLVEKNFM